MTGKKQPRDLMAALEESLTPEAIEARKAGAAAGAKAFEESGMREAVENVVAAEPVAPAKGESTYVIQVEAQRFDEQGTGIGACWLDVATITVPARTHRKRLIAKALTDAGIKPDPGQPSPRVRVLDEESAFVHEPGAEQPPAVWVV